MSLLTKDIINDVALATGIAPSYIETAANKFNALLWRIDIKDRTQPFNHMTNDPALMRHLYDLSLLYPSLKGQEKFESLSREIYKEDCKRVDKMRLLLS